MNGGRGMGIMNGNNGSYNNGYHSQPPPPPPPQQYYEAYDDYYSEEDDYYGGGNNGGYVPVVNHGPVPTPGDGIFPPTFQDKCRMLVFQEAFIIDAADTFIPPSGGTESDVGTLIVFEPDTLYDANGMSVSDTAVTGVCVRTQADGGGGNCHFTIADMEDDFIVTVSGFMADGVGGVMPFTGGAGALFGIIGYLDLYPIVTEGEDSLVDIFQADGYEVQADFALIRCPYKSPGHHDDAVVPNPQYPY